MYAYNLNEKVLIQNTGGAPHDPICSKLDGLVGRVVGYYHHPKHFTLVQFEQPIKTAYLKQHSRTKDSLRQSIILDVNVDEDNTVEYYEATVVALPNSCLRVVV